MAQSVGEKLKEARTGRGLSLDQVEKGTRIRRHYLEALERDDHDSLPSRVQAKGFLRLYADFLGLPTQALLAQWEGKPIEAEPAAPAPEPQAEAPSATAPQAAATEAGEAPAVPVKPAPPADEPEAPSPAEAAPETPEAVEVPAVPPRESQAIYQEIGAQLRRQREALSLSISDVERYTRLRQHYLRCMESGRLEELPSMVQGRGMLSNYASFLNLDSEAILLRYAEGLQQRRLERIPAPKSGLLGGQRNQRGARQASAARRLVTPDLLIGGGLIVVLFIFVIWTAARISSIRSGELQATLPSVGEVLLTTPSATLDLTAAAQPAGEETTSEAQAPAATLDAPPAESEAGPTATLAPLNSDPLQVYVVARQRAFLRVVTDGVIKFNGRVVPGNAYPFSGTQEITLLSGNAAAFQIFFNQTDLGALGRIGDVLNMTFTQAGVVTPTPQPTATLAPTEQITATPGPSPTVLTPTVTPLIP